MTMLAQLVRTSQPNLVYSSDMGLREQADFLFGKRVREERLRRGWSQEELAKRLADKGIPLYASTIAKIESKRKPRPVRLGEAAVIADLFDLPVDVLIDRQDPQETLTFALVTLASYARNAEHQIVQAQYVAADVEEQLEDTGERFDSPHIESLRHVVRNMAQHLDAAHEQARQMNSLATRAIAEAGEEVQR